MVHRFTLADKPPVPPFFNRLLERSRWLNCCRLLKRSIWVYCGWHCQSLRWKNLRSGSTEGGRPSPLFQQRCALASTLIKGLAQGRCEGSVAGKGAGGASDNSLDGKYLFDNLRPSRYQPLIPGIFDRAAPFSQPAPDTKPPVFLMYKAPVSPFRLHRRISLRPAS